MKTPFMQAYWQRRTDDIEDEIDAIRRSKTPHKRVLIEELQTAMRIAGASLQQAETIIVADQVTQFVYRWLEDHEPPRSWHFPDSDQIGYWIELETPIDNDDVNPFPIQAFHFAQVAKPGLDLLGITIPEHIRQRVDETQQEPTWILDVISAHHQGEFSIICKPVREQYLYTDDHVCPYGTCTEARRAKNLVCDQCKTLAIMVMTLTSVFLAASRGEFQEVEYREASPGKKEYKQDHRPMDKNNDVIIHRIDVRKRTIYTQPEQKESGEPRAHWKESYNADEIVTFKQKAKSHKRRYKDGREIDVKESRPRIYWGLKANRVKRLQ